ncbi:hypothetical protein OKA04_12830 [Luteolibacter flavescens]|uniref:Phage protein n=1 Tax=Luteolibacter flavescens TaxID=1859460 RepID=A0ABT3FPW5_9BACT|nr:hypothetical protein [Luteolibacter flavescens]MCW1885616.1 hypothetical protein [Luteolibacter flavescens]
MKARLLQLLHEGTAAVPVWANEMAKILVYVRMADGVTELRYEEFPEASNVEYLECAELVKEWIEKETARTSTLSDRNSSR